MTPFATAHRLIRRRDPSGDPRVIVALLREECRARSLSALDTMPAHRPGDPLSGSEHDEEVLQP